MREPYPLCVVGRCQWDTVYVAKLLCFPYETRDHKPFAQGRLCFCPPGKLHVQLISFQVSPKVGERLEEGCCLTLFLQADAGAPLLRVTADSAGRGLCTLSGEAYPVPRIRPFGGEDLQGVFWGVEFSLEGEALRRVFPAGLAVGQEIQGNLVTSRLGGDRPYWGSWAPTLPAPVGTGYQPDWLERVPGLGPMKLVDF